MEIEPIQTVYKVNQEHRPSVVKCIPAWAIGGNDFELPLNAGIPLGPDETYDTIMIEVPTTTRI